MGQYIIRGYRWFSRWRTMLIYIIQLPSVMSSGFSYLLKNRWIGADVVPEHRRYDFGGDVRVPIARQHCRPARAERRSVLAPELALLRLQPGVHGLSSAYIDGALLEFLAWAQEETFVAWAGPWCRRWRRRCHLKQQGQGAGAFTVVHNSPLSL